jgi:hypothetical protein
MGLLNYFGLDDLADGIRDFTDGIDELKNEIITSVVGPGEELKNTVNEIAGSISGNAPAVPETEATTPEAPTDTSQ